MMNKQIDGQMSIFDFLEPEKPKINNYWHKPLLERVHPRVQELYKAMMKAPYPYSRTKIIQAYNENKGLNFVADVCKEEYGTGGFNTEFGLVNYDNNHWVYRYWEPWEGVYQDEFTWREFARRICELIEARVYESYEPVCTFSSHTCNKEELFKVADALDETACPHVCCRSCATKMCGARCNGSEEPS